MFALKAKSAPREADALPASHLVKGFFARGRLETEGELTLDGAVKGRVDAGTLIIGPMGFIEGDVVAREVRVAGRLVGRIFAPTVTLEDHANVQGRIFHHAVTVARGARFEGRMPWRPLSFFDSLEQLPETQP